MTEDGKTRDLDLEWENRVLCSDESCIGTIGPDGRCRECGRPYEGTLPRLPSRETAAGGESQPDASDESDLSVSAEKPAEDKSTEENPDPPPDDAWERRTLCPDESCIGVIGPDGRCKECGRSL